jgi:hypothetical protein
MVIVSRLAMGLGVGNHVKTSTVSASARDMLILSSVDTIRLEHEQMDRLEANPPNGGFTE